jgi:hypothetical protein
LHVDRSRGEAGGAEEDVKSRKPAIGLSEGSSPRGKEW